MRELSGKVAVVTGGGSGIGRALVARLARLGTTVAVADIDLGSAQAVAGAAGPAATAHKVDVSSAAEFAALRDEVLEAHGAVDILVNNAGIGTAPRDFVETDLDAVRRMLEINLWGAINGTSAFLPHLLTRPQASLVNIGSYTGMLGTMGLVGYSTSKFAVRGFTESLRMELAGTPVTVTLVMPGVTRTGLMANSPLVEGERRRALADAFEKAPAIGPDKVAAAVVRGIRAGRPRVLTGVDTHLVDALTRIAPGHYSRLIHKPFKKLMARSLG